MEALKALRHHLRRGSHNPAEARTQTTLVLGFIVVPVALMLLMLVWLLATDIPPRP